MATLSSDGLFVIVRSLGLRCFRRSGHGLHQAQGIHEKEADPYPPMSNDQTPSDKFVFPRWANYLLPLIVVAGVGGGAITPAIVGLGFSAETLNVGYAPEQPVPYSHKLHAGLLGFDCRYCHHTVEDSPHASIPATETCINCHAANRVHGESPKLKVVRDSFATGDPIPWVKVHLLPDYVYFDHSIHVAKGVSCFTCHGQVDEMPLMYQAKSLQMEWCLDCHRQPEPHLRPQEFITKLDWEPDENPHELGARIREELNINPSTNCSTCHR